MQNLLRYSDSNCLNWSIQGSHECHMSIMTSRNTGNSTRYSSFIQHLVYADNDKNIKGQVMHIVFQYHASSWRDCWTALNGVLSIFHISSAEWKGLPIYTYAAMKHLFVLLVACSINDAIIGNDEIYLHWREPRYLFLEKAHLIKGYKRLL